MLNVAKADGHPNWFAPTTMDEFNSVAKSGKPSFVKFTASWCPPCRAVQPVLDELAEAHKDNFTFIYVDCDTAGPVAANFGVSGIPDMRFFDKEGNEAEKYNGARDKDSINAAFAKHQ